MPNQDNSRPLPRFRARHRSRSAQVGIYLGKLLRMFVYQNDWKVLPMAALIAGLVGMVIRRRMFVDMEGSIMGSFALVCVCIWNGCFNSIQVICRERDVVKREHRSGMHISTYIFSHMIYQFLLCLMQTGVTLYVIWLIGVHCENMIPLFTPWPLVDLGISMLLICYASDMLSLWVSSLARSTTAAMTVMPFVLIFQLVFSGGMLTLPAWTAPLTHFTVSNPGLKVIAAQADVNLRPFVTISNMITKMREEDVSGTVTVGMVLDLLQKKDDPAVAQLRSIEMGEVMDFAQWRQLFEGSGTYGRLREEELFGGMTVGDLLDAVESEGILEEYDAQGIVEGVTFGEVIDTAAADPQVQAKRDEELQFETKVGTILDLMGEDNVKAFLEEKAAKASYVPAYDRTRENIMSYWRHLVLFVFAFSLLATITLEFIDKDRR